MTTTTSVDPFAALNAKAGATTTNQSDAGSADRFLKLLVAQMQNQDPMNPMDNAEITSQMAQINTVSGISTLNSTVQGLNAQFVQMQALQGASLVGHDVTLPGNRLAIADGVGVGAFEIDGTADSVTVDVLDGSGRVVDTIDLRTMEAGRHPFEWKGAAKAAGGEYTFKVDANAGKTRIDATALMLDRVDAVSMDGDTLTLELERSGSVPYGKVKAFN